MSAHPESLTARLGLDLSGTRTLEIVFERLEPGRLRVRPRGELDLATAEQLQQRLIAALGHDRSVLLDLANVPFIDSTGLAAILAVVAYAEASGARLELARPLPPQPQRLMELTGVLPGLAMRDSTSAASDAPPAAARREGRDQAF